MTDIKIEPDLWEEDVEGVITAWLFSDGETVSAGTVVAELMVEKIQHELISPVGGTLRVLVEAEQPVNKGDVVARVE
ncbi:lipoyl domain-containing protein [Hyphococcus formosus]|uniref:biotin/lipoyl-containing protein n=1 Tax=Hyphococcus formosus TaxID=3143534 RepID=UPI00398B5B30